MSLFEAYNQQQAQQSYAPQQRANLQTAYNQALGQRTPNWAIHLSNAMPSIAEIIAAGTTKGAFNQGRIADSLERQKNRQIAYTQALQNMEDNRVKDYVQMAKDQLNLDIANEQEAYNRDLTAQNIAYQKELDRIKQANIDREFENMLDQQKIDNDYRKEYFEWLKSQAKENANTKSQEQNYKQVQETLANIENINGKLNKLQQAKDLNNTTSQKSDFGTILKASWNPFAAAPSENRLSPIYQAFTTENEPKKAEMELEKLGLNKNMSREDYNRNIDRLINDNRNEIIKEYAKLGYKILQDDETGAIRVVDNNGNTIQEF